MSQTLCYDALALALKLAAPLPVAGMDIGMQEKRNRAHALQDLDVREFGVLVLAHARRIAMLLMELSADSQPQDRAIAGAEWRTLGSIHPELSDALVHVRFVPTSRV